MTHPQTEAKGADARDVAMDAVGEVFGEAQWPVGSVKITDGKPFSFTVHGVENGKTYSYRQLFKMAKEQGAIPEDWNL